MGFERSDRVSEEIKKEVSYLILHRLKDPRIGFVSITDVEVSGDLQYAKIFVSIMGNENEKKESLAGLESAAGFIRTAVGEKIRLKHVPKIVFELDESIERGTKILKLLKEVRDEEEKKEQ